MSAQSGETIALGCVLARSRTMRAPRSAGDRQSAKLRAVSTGLDRRDSTSASIVAVVDEIDVG